MPQNTWSLFEHNAANYGYEIAGLLSEYRIMLWQRRNTRDTLAPVYDERGNLTVTLPSLDFYQGGRERILEELEICIPQMKIKILKTLQEKQFCTVTAQNAAVMLK